MRTITLYGKPDCCLCEQARSVIERIGAGHDFRFEEVDITSDDALHRRFLVRIPVVALDGEELYDYEVDEQDLVVRLGGESSANRRG